MDKNRQLGSGDHFVETGPRPRRSREVRAVNETDQEKLGRRLANR
jgi:hypothetical protein